MSSTSIESEREAHSRLRLNELKDRLAALQEVTGSPELTIFGAGSYARLEASQYSDIDLFFLTAGPKEEFPEPRRNSLLLFGKIIETIDDLGFPKFSNDCEYLVLIHTDDILHNLGSRTDDHENYFTARMLLLLESHCLFGESVYQSVTEKIVDSYFNDFPDHQKTFSPMFLMNDICRFWKTLLLNYENRRAIKATGNGDEEALAKRKTKHKVRNFKLKFSRMTTCFASIAALGSYSAPVNREHVLELISLTPRERLLSISERVSSLRPAVDAVLSEYSWFLTMTGLSTAELESHFADKMKRTEMFDRANKYGDAMFDLLGAIDEGDKSRRLLRNLVI